MGLSGLTWRRPDSVRRRGGRACGGLAGAPDDQRCGAGGAGALRHRDGRDVRGAHRLRHRRYVSRIAERICVCREPLCSREEKRRESEHNGNVEQWPSEAGKHLLSLLSELLLVEAFYTIRAPASPFRRANVTPLPSPLSHVLLSAVGVGLGGYDADRTVLARRHAILHRTACEVWASLDMQRMQWQ